MSDSAEAGKHEHDDDKQECAGLLRANLARAKSLRIAANADPRNAAERLRLREWQAARLERTHADLLQNPRYGPAASFFLSDIYGPKDFSARDNEIERILPKLVAMLPVAALRMVALAIEVDALSEELDAAIITQLRRAGTIGDIRAETYADAYRRCDNRAQRELQLSLIGEIGHALDRATRKPLLNTALRLMRKPAHLAGLGDLHGFLERGFNAFRQMKGADEFLDTIMRRESALLQQIWSADATGLAPPQNGTPRRAP